MERKFVIQESYSPPFIRSVQRGQDYECNICGGRLIVERDIEQDIAPEEYECYTVKTKFLCSFCRDHCACCHELRFPEQKILCEKCSVKYAAFLSNDPSSSEKKYCCKMYRIPWTFELSHVRCRSCESWMAIVPGEVPSMECAACCFLKTCPDPSNSTETYMLSREDLLWDIASKIQPCERCGEMQTFKMPCESFFCEKCPPDNIHYWNHTGKEWVKTVKGKICCLCEKPLEKGRKDILSSSKKLYCDSCKKSAVEIPYYMEVVGPQCEDL
jgi:hypothetical protein